VLPLRQTGRVNLGILLVGLVGGLVVGLGLSFQEKQDTRRRLRLAAEGVQATGTVTEVTATGRFSAFRRVTVRIDGGGSFVQTFDMSTALDLGLAEGQRFAVRHRVDDPTDAMLDAGPPPPSRPSSVPLVAGAVIVVLGVLAALVV
jgi:hypothetical protein